MAVLLPRQVSALTVPAQSSLSAPHTGRWRAAPQRAPSPVLSSFAENSFPTSAPQCTPLHSSLLPPLKTEEGRKAAAWICK